MRLSNVFSEIIKLIPSMDRAAMGKLFSQLNQRFASLTKKFGEGMKNAFKLTGVVGIVGGLVSKLLNPLEKAEEIINRISAKGDDAMTNAEEFQSDPGKLLRLEALAATKGLDAETLRTLLGKFQGALAKEQEIVAAPERLQKEIVEIDRQIVETRRVEAEGGAMPDGREPEARREELQSQRERLVVQVQQAQAAVAQGGMLREFVGETDIADAFFKFVQSMQQLDKSQQTVIQSEVFGERIRGKAAEFFNAKDFDQILRQLPSVEALAAAAEKSGAVADKADLLRAIRESQDFVRKSSMLDESQISAIDQSERQKMRGEDQTLQRFDELKATNIAVQELTHKFDQFATDFITNVAPMLVTGVNKVGKFVDEFMPSFQETKAWVVENGGVVVEKANQIADWTLDVGVEASLLIDRATEKVSSAVDAVTGLWDEFKSGPIYRLWK